MTLQRRPISFLATTKPDSARGFYGDVLGLNLLEQSPHALVFRDGEIMLRVQIVQDLPVVSHNVHGWQVDDIEAQIAQLASRGAVFLSFDHLCQTASGVWTTPVGHKIAWFKDPDGNILSLIEVLKV